MSGQRSLGCGTFADRWQFEFAGRAGRAQRSSASCGDPMLSEIATPGAAVSPLI
jgi:hypothetical protein